MILSIKKIGEFVKGHRSMAFTPGGERIQRITYELTFCPETLLSTSGKSS